MELNNNSKLSRVLLISGVVILLMGIISLLVYFATKPSSGHASSPSLGPSTTPGQTPVPSDTLFLGSSLSTISTGTSNANKENSSEPYLQSQNGVYRLYLQTDGNLVVYDTTDGSAIFSSYTGSDSGQSLNLTLQSDGNLVLKANQVVLWQTDTQGLGGTMLVLQNDSNLVLYNNNSKTESYWSSIGGKITITA